MKIPPGEQVAIRQAIAAAKRFGFGNLIAHLQTAWAKELMCMGMDEAGARRHSGGHGYPFLMQDDIVERGEWDCTGERYRGDSSLDAVRGVVVKIQG